ncbi:hypothetical protein C943_00126 [Mariniradius saccharolyticus AK6]|uniref:Uncharacterized protein n=1 Tax=Mariniradius saccharolyticus AK6 TaxID=1239962 RepID=M7XLL0_9BACT|nr:hypothetical protein C943_00126 [Mariniradius saccharolyticus AK6]
MERGLVEELNRLARNQPNFKEIHRKGRVLDAIDGEYTIRGNFCCRHIWVPGEIQGTALSGFACAI